MSKVADTGGDNLVEVTISTTTTMPPLSATPDDGPAAEAGAGGEEKKEDTPDTTTTTTAKETQTQQVSSNVPGEQEQPHKADDNGDQDDSEPEAATTTASTEALPPLTPEEFRVYNRLADVMDHFHNHFRQIWTTLHTAATTNRRPANLTLRQFLDEALRLTQYLEAHHSIEETHLYPLLARKMPEFRSASHSHSSLPSRFLQRPFHNNKQSSSTSSSSSLSSSSEKGGGGKDKGGRKGKGKGRGKDCELLEQHKAIHAGMEVLEEYIRACKRKECEFELSVLKEKMDSWGEVLFTHLDQEVRDLGAENMRRYWTMEEMREFPI